MPHMARRARAPSASGPHPHPAPHPPKHTHHPPAKEARPPPPHPNPTTPGTPGRCNYTAPCYDVQPADAASCDELQRNGRCTDPFAVMAGWCRWGALGRWWWCCWWWCVVAGRGRAGVGACTLSRAKGAFSRSEAARSCPLTRAASSCMHPWVRGWAAAHARTHARTVCLQRITWLCTQIGVMVVCGPMMRRRGYRLTTQSHLGWCCARGRLHQLRQCGTGLPMGRSWRLPPGLGMQSHPEGRAISIKWHVCRCGRVVALCRGYQLALALHATT